MAKAKYEGPEELLELYETLVAGNESVDRKGAKNPYTSRNGHMFSFLTSDGAMALRMSPEMGDEFVGKYESGPVEQHGRTMNGYVSVPDSLLRSTAELRVWFDASHDWIGTLKPKATTKSKQ